MYRYRFIFALLFWAVSSLAVADSSGPFRLDHRLNFDQTGVWASSNQKAVEYGAALMVIGGAVFEGTESRLGQTFWKSLDAMLFGDVSALAAKSLFRRQRPIDGNHPGAFFKSSADKSFPSGEMTHITAIVTPFILEYQKDSPSVRWLAVLPAYVGIARLKSQEHWQTDILAAAALGVGIGYIVSQRDSAWSAGVLSDGFSVGYRKKF